MATSAAAAGPCAQGTRAADRPPADEGPLRRVLSAFEAGAVGVEDLARRTGLSRDVVEGAVEHLVRLGRIEARALSLGCPSGGCGTCASGRPDGSAGCGSCRPARTAGRGGPVLVALRLRRPA